MNNQPRRLLILRWTRARPAAGAPARWLIDLPAASPVREPFGQPGGCSGGSATPLAPRGGLTTAG
ncbi:MAG: hypothetical protein QOF83_2297 [Solirubrobacteraceae bacterium]|jgi:hypothetical protein|nr:hypothetical protein [Solirubrobacteraceae bacterium]